MTVGCTVQFVSATSDSIATELLPLALVIALSPLSIIPGILILHTARPRPNGLAFLAGWLLGLVALTAISIGVSGMFGELDQPPRWAPWVRLVIGAALIVFGVWRWLNRHGSSHEIPGMSHISDADAGKAFAVGAILTVANPKVLFVCAAAGFAIGTAGMRTSGAVLATLVFAAVASLTVTVPVVAYTLSGDRLDLSLARIKGWMEQHNAALVAGILVFIGLLLLYKGIHGL
jgi:threonine/homoserine/homoserine lactone efflux protein